VKFLKKTLQKLQRQHEDGGEQRRRVNIVFYEEEEW
jgi:hypothetical protein